MEEVKNTITLLKALSHPARLAILEVLRQGEACVCHMEALFGWRQAYISQQLMVLREAGIVEDRRDGWNVYYRVVKPDIYSLVDLAYKLSEEEVHFQPENVISVCTCPKCKVQLTTSAP
ncbi:MAG: ArsR/SmtB family transcription factor [Chloroflexota bacterium]